MRFQIISLSILLGFFSSSAVALTANQCSQITTSFGFSPAECDVYSTAAMQPTFPFSISDRTDVLAIPIEEPTDEMRQNNIFFQGGGDVLSPSALLRIQQLANLLNGETMRHTCISLVGYSDSTGSALINQEIAAKRATAVRNRLILLLRNSAQIEGVRSMGEEGALPGLADDDPWQRRVEIWARNCAVGQ